MPAAPIRLIAFYLPQYHPIPENDAWWGNGFTEWTNVRTARPLFGGHYQPHVPADLGYYDLRDPVTRAAQADLAREHGIYGFCYYHYWFEGKRLLGHPLDEVLISGKPDLPFCLCWANHHWSRMWDDQPTQLLIRQTYSEEDNLAHMDWLARAFLDPRYIRIEGKPVFLVYHASGIPDPLRATMAWREVAQKLGVGEIFLCKVESFQERRFPPSQIGFDAAVQFQPDTKALLTTRERIYWVLAKRFGLRHGTLVCDYAEWIRRASRRLAPPYKCFPCVTPSWDNVPRRATGAFILNGSTPELYEGWLRATMAAFQPASRGENLVFINAWNEWGESNHLEPCQKWGRGYLEATRRVISDWTKGTGSHLQ
jgi:lipopolysaccharide biosynthesis protein